MAKVWKAAADVIKAATWDGLLRSKDGVGAVCAGKLTASGG